MINHLPNRTDFVPIIPVTPEQIEVGQLVTLQAADVQRREGDRLMQAQRAEKKRTVMPEHAYGLPIRKQTKY